MSLTRRWRQAVCLSRIVLSHTPRQSSVCLIFDVARKMNARFREQLDNIGEHAKHTSNKTSLRLERVARDLPKVGEFRWDSGAIHPKVAVYHRPKSARGNEGLPWGGMIRE